MSSVARARPRRFASWALAGLALLISHDLVWLVQVGPGASLATALRGAGHGYWDVASLALTAAAAAAGLAVLRHVLRLRRRAEAIGAAPARPSRTSYLRRVGGAWARLFVVVALGFALQENVEHAVAHGHLMGLGALVGAEYPLALPVIAVITGLAAALAAVVISVEHELRATIIAALRRRLRPDAMPPTRPRRERLSRVASPLASAGAGRAPPLPIVA